MSLYLYDKTDTSFNNEGLGVLLDFVDEPEVTENINGFFELTFTYALGGHLAEHLNEEMYISSKTNEHDDEYLVFRIYESEPDYVDGSVIIRARLKQTDDFMNSIVKARTLLKGDIGFQLRSMMSNSTPTLNYRVGGTVNGVLDIEREDDNIFNMLFDDNGLFTLNGITPKFTSEGITITKERAWSTASVITEKNFIEQLTINTSRRDMVTQIIPFTETRRDVLTPNEDSKYHKRETIEEKVYGTPVISPKVASMGYPVITRFMEFRNDVKEELKMDETEYNTYLYESVDDLNKKAKTFFTDNEGIDEYEVEVSIETLGLHMDDYEQISSLGLYDMVEIYLEEYGVNVPVQVMEVTYSPLIGRNTQLKLTSKFNRIEHASNRINSNAPSEQELRDFIQNQIINNKINETVHNFIIKDDGTKISYVNQLPPVETAIEGDVVFLVTEEGGSIWEFVNGVWVEVLPLNFKQHVTDQLTEVFNQFDTERTETEQAINEALESAKAEAERLDKERQTIIDGKFEEVNNANEALEQSIATAEQNAQNALEKAGANASLLTTHQDTLNTINTVTLPDIASSAGTALANAKDAMDEAKLADDKIANFVTTNGLVNGTTVDSKIDEATGEISKKITTVEGKIPTSVGGRNYVNKSNEYYFTTDYKIAEYNLTKILKGTKIKISIWGGLDSGARTFGIYVNNASGLTSDNSQKIELTKLSGLHGQGRSTSLSKWTAEVTLDVDASKILVYGFDNNTTTPKRIEYIKIETGGLFTDWSAAPEDNYTQEEFKIFESTYNEDVRGINSSLTALENSKLDGSTYTTFYKNEYEKTAQGLKDAYTKIDKVIDKYGNTTDSFAKAVYDQNATRQSADFNEVTKDLVKQNTYTAGINGLSGSISTISGRVDKLVAGGGGRNYALKSNAYYYTTDYKVSEYDLVKMLKGTKIKISIWGALGTNTRTFGVYVNNGLGTPSDNSQKIELTKLNGLHGQGAYASLEKWTGEATLQVDATKILVFGLDNNTTSPKRIEYVKVETGETYTDWTIAPEDTLGKADFQVFKTTYEATDKLIKERLLAIDSGKEGSLAYRLNETEKTASGNTTTIANIKKSPEKQITGYQTIKERSDLYERVIGKDEAGIKSNMARMVMTDSLFKTEVIKNVPSAIGGRNYVLKSNEYYYTNNYKVAEYDLSTIPKGTKIKISLWGGLSSLVRTFGVYVNNSSGLQSGNSQRVELTKQSGLHGQGASTTLEKWTAEITLGVDAKKILIYGFDNNSTSPKRVEYVQIETGDYYTDWTAAPEDKADQSQVTQLSNSWALTIQDATGLKTAINATTDGIRLKGSLITLDGQVNMTSSFIVPEGNIGNLNASKITAGQIDSSRINVSELRSKILTTNVVKSTHILANEALFTKLFTNDLATQKLATKQAWIKSSMIGDAQIGTAQIGQIDASNGRIVNLDASSITSGTMTANRIRGGTLTSTNGATSFNLNTGQLSFVQQGVAIKNQFSGRPLQYLAFDSGTIHGSPGSYTALMSNSGNVVTMNENSAGIQIWNSFDKKTAVNLYGNNITFMRNAKATGSIDIDTVNNTINGLRIVPLYIGSTPGVALMYGKDAGLWIGGYGDFAFKHNGGWIGKANIIN